ncbi:MAG: hypothetical protein QXW37_09185 [Candidatus Nitrosotenuis sp.]
MKAKIIGISLIGVISVAVIAAILFVGPIDVARPKEQVDEFKNWNRSGPFAINKHEYKLGENIFIAINNLQPGDIGSMVFLMPNATRTYISIPFDATAKPGFNQYFKPSISKARNICSVDDLVGEWTVVFKGTNYSPLKFRIINQTIPGDETLFQRVC